MAAKKKTSKTDFVRKFPDLPAADVVKKGAEAGLRFSDKYVYKVRAMDRSKSKKPAAVKVAPVKAASAKAAAPAKAAPAAAAPAAAKSGKMTTTDFVKSLPPKMSYKEAAERATKLGIKLSKGYFYVLKSGAKKAPGAPKAAAAPKGKPGRKPASAVAAKGLRLTSDDPNEQALINAVRALGFDRSRGLIGSVEKFERG